jgi:5'(3')-deoxyribonucleotidase
MKVALDLDGVLADIHETVRLDVSVVLGLPLYYNDCKSWHWLTDYYGYMENESWEYYRNVWAEHNPSDIKPVEPDVAYLTQQLCCLGEVDIVTAHEDSARSNILDWLYINGVFFNTLKMHGYNDKSTLDYDVFIDDYPKTISKVVAKGKLAFYFQHPYNVNVPVEGAVRVKGLREVVEYLERSSAKYEFIRK